MNLTSSGFNNKLFGTKNHAIFEVPPNIYLIISHHLLSLSWH